MPIQEQEEDRDSIEDCTDETNEEDRMRRCEEDFGCMPLGLNERMKKRHQDNQRKKNP